MLRILLRTNKLCLVVFFLLLLALSVMPFKEADAVSRPACSEVVGKFFPAALVGVNFGTPAESYVPYQSAGREQCTYRIANQTRGARTDFVFVSVSTGNPSARFSCPSGRRLPIGDDSCIYDHGGRAKKNNYIFEVNAYIYDYSVRLSQLKRVPSEVERLLTHAVSQVADLPDPTIDSITPQTTTAGVKMSYDERTGVVVYGVNRQAFEIIGQNLTGSSITSDHKNVDESRAIQFSQIRISPDGRRLTGFMNVSPKAKDGQARIKVTNLSGKSATTEVAINITGTQYLKRKFASQRVSFYGDWPELMPYDDPIYVENQVNAGLEAINKPSYESLGIFFRFYEYENLWVNHAATSVCSSALALGCTYDAGQDIYVAILGKFGGTILHESAHKLHAYFAGLFHPNGLLTAPENQFEAEWETAVGDLSQCQFLPLSSNTRWADGNTGPPRCGFAEAYGAYRYKTMPFTEDVATLVHYRKFRAHVLQTGDGPTDPRYPLKYSILDRYGF